MDTVSRGYTKALEIVALWNGVSGEVKIEINTDFTLAQLDAQSIGAISTAKELGHLRLEDMLKLFQKGELVDESVTLEEFKTGIEEEAPILSVPPIKKETKAPPKEDNGGLMDDIRKRLGI